MELYMENREHESKILESVKNGPLIWPTIEENGVTRTKKYDELSATEKIQADCDVKSTNIILQGLPSDVYALVNNHRIAKDLWERIQLLMQVHQDAYPQPPSIPQIEYSVSTVNQQTHLAEFPQIDSGLAVPMFKQGDNPIDAINKMMPFLSTVISSHFPSTNNQLRNSSNPRQQATIHDGRVTDQPLQGRQSSYATGTSGTRANVLGTGGSNSGQQRVFKCFNCQRQAQGSGKVLNEEELPFLADPRVTEGPVSQTVITHNAAYQADDLDAYDFECDEISTAQEILMANLSCYGSDVLSEVPHSEYTHNDMLYQSVQEMPYSEQTHLVNHPETEINSDSNIIPYSQYLLETQNATVHDTNSSAQQDAMILSVFEQLSNQVTNCNKVNKDNLIANESLFVELERYKNQFTDFEKEINSLKQTLSEQLKEKETLTKTFNVFKNESKEKEDKNIDKEIAFEKKVKELDNIKAQQIRPMLYDGNVITEETNLISIADSEETLMLENESRSKMILKQSDPMVLEKKFNTKLIYYVALNRLSEDFGKCFVPQTLFDEQALWLQNSYPITNQSASSSVKIEAPRELPKKYKQFLTRWKLRFNSVVKTNSALKFKRNFFLNENDRLLDQIISQDIMNIVVISYVDMNNSVNVNESSFVAINDSVNYVEKCNQFLKLEAELIKQHNMVEKDEYNKLSKSYSKLEQHCISLELAMQLNKEIFQKNNTSVNQTEPKFDQLFALNNLKAELQAKDTTIEKLKENIKRLNKTSTTNCVKKDIDEIETINIELDNRVAKLIAENEHLKQTYKQLYDSIKPSRVKVLAIIALENDLRKLKGKHIVDNAAQMSKATTIALGLYKLDPVTLAPKVKNNREAHIYYLQYTMEQAAILREIVEHANSLNPLDSASYSACKYVKLIQELLGYVKDTCPVVQIVLWYLDSGCSKYMTRDRSQLTNFIYKFLSTFKFDNDQIAKIMVYGDYQIGNVTISRVYYVEGLGHNLFSVGQFCDSDLEVAFRKHSCFVHNLEGVDLLSESQETNLYTLSIGDMMASSPICLLSKASKTKSWLWHRRLSHLNFGAINHLAKNGLVRGLPKLKFEKDNLCAACAMGKSKKQMHKPKSEDTNQEKLYLLHMGLCGPMRVASVNGKMYILVIVDDYSRFTWVKFLASKDEAPDFIIKFMKMIQVRLNATVRNICTDNGTEFVNQTLSSYYESVGISHQTLVARTPQQNGVVERRNRTLVEAARTMLIYTKAPLFLWAEAVATASLCYSTNDSENLGKLQAKADIGIFIGYAPKKKAYHIYNRRTYKIIETIHVNFDELAAMASEQSSLEPALHEMTPTTLSSGLVPNLTPPAPFVPPSRKEWDLVFQPVFDEFFSTPASVASPVPAVVAPAPVVSTGTPSSTTVDQDASSLSISQTTPQSQSQEIPLSAEEESHDLEVAHMRNDPCFGIPSPATVYEESPKTPKFNDDPLHESLYEDSTSQGSSSNVQPSHTLLELIGRWTKDHPLANVIGDPS
ncbi:retrovirus-related pol polyprotein from transposon TNT 1-94 [Tanacetum coccineum]|uniref:Retrovirus-related pol polyprotein from transposon TNT 1-94 n=1 Tax=Tanacetum coccineum TaxID=301880 RepID=A0ABQ5E8R7_9ASTR